VNPQYILTPDGVVRPAEDFNPMSLRVGDEYDLLIPGQPTCEWFKVTGWGTGSQAGPRIRHMGYRDAPSLRSAG